MNIIENGFNGVGKNVKQIFRAFSSRNYKLFFAGQSVSLVGTWLQRTAMSWLVYRMTSSEFLLGMVSFLALVPVFIISPFAGVLADRVNRRQFLVVTQIFSMTQALMLAALVLTDNIKIGHIMFLAAFLGTVNAFDNPVRQSFTVQLVEKIDDLGNAIALNSAMFNGARLIGPSIAGIIIALVGEGFCFLINGLSYVAVIAALLLMNIPFTNKGIEKKNMMQGIKEGFLYSFGFSPIRSVLLLLVFVSLMGAPYMVLMPVFAKDIFHGGSHTLGFLMSAAGGGALAGAVFLASRKTATGLETVIPCVTGIFGFGLIAFSLSRWFLLSLIILFATGFSMIVHMASSNTILQTIVDEEKRGRVMSFYVMCVMGTVPFGSLLSGTIASTIGTPVTIFIGGVFCIAGTLLFVRKLPELKKSVRQIYIEKGVTS